MSAQRMAIAVVGYETLFPGSTNRTGFWRDILAGRDCITDVPPSHWLLDDYYDANPGTEDKTYGRRGGFIPSVPFSTLEFGMPPNVLRHTDTTQLLALLLAKQVLSEALGEDVAAQEFPELDRVGVILGVASGTQLASDMVGRIGRPIWQRVLRQRGFTEARVRAICDAMEARFTPWSESTFPGLLSNVVAGRIANRLNLGGENFTVDAACASSLAAVEMAVRALESGSADLMLTGGVDALNTIFTFTCFTKTPALSPTGDSRPFSDQADGTILGEGVGVLALKRLADAERDGNAIYAVIRGIGSSSDGRAKSVYAPHAKGQAKALRRAYEMAGYAPRTVELVEGHGTATAAGDAAEVEALREVFEADGAPSQAWCALGSVKSQIGHTKAAAGAAGLFKAVMALHHKVLPPTIKVERPNPELKLEESAFYLNTEARPWIRAKGQPRRASVSSFGFGGSNYHVTLEEYQGPKRPGKLRTSGVELVLVSGASAGEVVERSQGLLADLAAGATLVELARQTQLAWDHAKPARLAVLAADEAELGERLQHAISHIQAEPERSIRQMNRLHYAVGREPGKVAFLFPGQGSQYIGMGADLAMTFEAARAVWDEVAEVEIEEGLRVHDVVFPQPVFTAEGRRAQQERLTRTEWAQPCIAAASMAGLAVLRSLNIQPDCVAGHSFGELTALHAAGAMDARTLIALARHRGERMAAASDTPGAMFSVFARESAFADLMRDLPVVVANRNAPEQVVVGGPLDDMLELERRLTKAGIRSTRLNVSTAFHSPLVAAAADDLAETLSKMKVSRPTIPVISNTYARPYPATVAQIKRQIAQQLAKPVLFQAQIDAMYDQGVRTFIEVGPGSTLAGLTTQCLVERSAVVVSLDKRGQRLNGFWNGLAQLAVAGLPMDFSAMWQEFQEIRAQAPAKGEAARGAVVMLNGSNVGKPYPRIRPNGPALRPAEQPGTAAPQPTLDRGVVTLVPVRPGGTSILDGFPRHHRVAVTDDGRGVAQALVRRLRDAGYPASVVRQVPDDAKLVIHLAALRDLDRVESAIGCNEEAFLLCQGLSTEFRADGRLVLVQSTDGDFGASGRGGARAWSAGIASLAKTVAREWPGVQVKALDIAMTGQRVEDVARRIFEEISQGGATLEVGLQPGDVRVTPVVEPRPLSYANRNRAATLLDPGAVVVVTGGARGVTGRCLEELAKEVQPQFVIFGRTRLRPEWHPELDALDHSQVMEWIWRAEREAGRRPVPAALSQRAKDILAERDVRQTLHRLSQAGAKVAYQSVDVRDSQALHTAIQWTRRQFGPIAGLIHGAGVIEDALISDKSVEQFRRVFETKVRPAQVFLEATKDDPIRLICLFSSVAARYGNQGQSDYAMANEVLNKVARQEQARRGASCVVRSIAWGPWDGGMVDGALKSHLTRLGVGLIDIQTGARAFVEELLCGDGHPEVVVQAMGDRASADMGRMEVKSS
ncbi:MAG: SDR family NAD(P)-dependent oxidoreductase [Alicyclobacillus sp.]|nr:SDR family NAD(P)-dependent oxidoreductase [Alicyclobacillus sp.]